MGVSLAGIGIFYTIKNFLDVTRFNQAVIGIAGMYPIKGANTFSRSRRKTSLLESSRAIAHQYIVRGLGVDTGSIKEMGIGSTPVTASTIRPMSCPTALITMMRLSPVILVP